MADVVFNLEGTFQESANRFDLSFRGSDGSRVSQAVLVSADGLSPVADSLYSETPSIPSGERSADSGGEF